MSLDFMIQGALERIETEHNVQVLLAVESGSRAWGFASSDSDYDVRFIYVHDVDWYLAIDLNTSEKRDVIEIPIVDELDVNGWDLRKALQLLSKSNPPLLEWLKSPIVYRESSLAAELRDLSARFYSSRACFWHYLHMMRKNVREYLQGEEVWIKKYFYVLRPLLAMRWIEKYKDEPVPVEFEVLLYATTPEGELREHIEELLKQKRNGTELGRGPRIPVISDFIARALQSTYAPSWAAAAPQDIEDLNAYFRHTVRSMCNL